MKVFIATPTMGGTASIDYARSLAAATLALSGKGLEYEHFLVDGAEIVFARNILAHRFMSDPRNDAILFVDSDMAIHQGVFEHFLTHFSPERPMIGAAYSERRLDLERYFEAMQERADDARARALASRFNVRIESGEKQVKDQLCPVRGFGFGCVLIHRRVFEGLVARSLATPLVSTKFQQIGERGQPYDYFGRLRMASGEELSEDYAFCERVQQLGDVEVHAYVGSGVEHVGPFRYSAPYIERLKEGLT